MPVARHYRFGDFCLDTAERCLLRNGERVPLTPKALETLVFLVERHGHIVEKKALMDAVWPNTFVEEVSLARNVSVLRRIFSDAEQESSYIETIPKRGYRFVAEVSELPDDEGLTTGKVVFRYPADSVDLSMTGRRKRQRLVWLLSALIALLMAGSFAYWITSSHPVLSFSERSWVLISDFQNHTGDPRFDKALLTALTVSIEQSRYVNVLPRSRVYQTLQRMGRAQDLSADFTINEALGREICLRESIRALLVSELTRTGTQYRLIVRLVDPRTGNEVRAYTRKITGEEGILDSLDSVASDVRHDLGETPLAVLRDDRPLAQVTTSSLTALQHFSEAIQLWNKARYQDAQAQLQEAVHIDPEFAMAHAALGANLYSHIFSDPRRGQQEYERALQLSKHITDRERMFIEANFAGAKGPADQAERLYRVFLANYPDDNVARFDLANLLVRQSRCDEAIQELQHLIRVDAANASARIQIATCYANNSKYAEALPYYQRAFELDPFRLTSANLSHEYGFTLVGDGRFNKAREVFEAALGHPESRARALRSLGLLDIYLGQYDSAVTQFGEAVDASESHGDALAALRTKLYLATTYEGMEDHTRELRVLDEATKSTQVLQQVSWLAYRFGIAYARAGAVKQAVRIQEIAKVGGSIDDAETRSNSDRLQGEILLAQNDPVQAVALLEKAHRENHPPLTPLTFDSLGRAYEKANRREQAIAAYESLIRNEGGNPLGWEPQQPWLEAHYALAKLYAANGNPLRARQLLDQLLAIWKDADSHLPLLKQAKDLRETLSQ